MYPAVLVKLVRLQLDSNAGRTYSYIHSSCTFTSRLIYSICGNFLMILKACEKPADCKSFTCFYQCYIIMFSTRTYAIIGTLMLMKALNLVKI